MTDKAISPLRQRLIEYMAIRRLGPKTQQHYGAGALIQPAQPDTAAKSP